MKKIFILLMFCAVTLYGIEIKLMDNGNPACTIVVKPDASVVEKHAASELSVYLGKISGGKAPVIASQIQKGTIPVRFALTKDKKLDAEGFMIRTSQDGITIYGKEEVGFLYGVYNILRRYGGIRWLTPGEDGEYFQIKKTITIPEGEWVSNPSFKYRNISWGNASTISQKWASFDWMLHNGLRIYDEAQTILARDLREKLKERAAVVQDGGHCFSILLGGWKMSIGKDTYKAYQNRLRKMYKEHPDYFPLINGKRTFLEGEKYQPCSSNPEVIKIMANNLLWKLNNVCSQTPGGRFRLVNNDGTGWCQCENCRKLDRGSALRTNRYWSFMNALAEITFKEKPDAILNTIAYQDYKYPPKDVMPDKRFATIELSFNRICYRHKLDDPNCQTNREYLKLHKEWKALSEKLGIPLVTYGQIDALGSTFMPIEDVYPHDMRLYFKQLGITGIRPQLSPPDGKYGPRYARSPMVKLCWYGIWQTMYLFAAQAWDINIDTDKVYEEINRLYYGEKAWNAGMKDFRKLLSKSFREAPGCYGYGHSSPLGRCLDRPGVQEQLNKYLNAAEKAAATDPDKRALFHVQREKKIFQLTWEKFRADYKKNYKEISSYRRTQPIRIDGVLDEFDWQNADTITNFKITGNDPRPAKVQTYVRVVHEPEFIYFGVECMEPLVDRMTEEIKKRDGDVWNDNTLEIFLNHPDLGGAYYQIIINSAGTVFDHFVQPGSKADKSYDSQIEVKTRKLKDRWILECRIPTAPVGEKCFDGQSWKINILRSRKINGIIMPSGNPVESSTWSIGYPHGVGNFLPVHFCAKRLVSYLGTGKDADARAWRNGSFSETSTLKSTKRYTIKNDLMPAHWGPVPDTVLSLESDPQSNNRFLRLRGMVQNVYHGRSEKVKIRLSARGKGTIRFMWYCFDVVKGQRIQRKVVSFHKEDISSEDWKNIVFTADFPMEYKVVKFSVRAIPSEKNGFIDLDEIYISPVVPKEK